MADIAKCQKLLFELAEKQGYLTFDDILNLSNDFSLSVAEVDSLSEAIHLRGIIVYESAPTIGQQELLEEDVFDYSRTDYEAVFLEILELVPQLGTLIAKIKEYPPPQHGEISHLTMQAAEGNTFARERLIMLYMRTVLKIALSTTKQYELDLEDAISSGFIGLMNAVDKYDPMGFSAFHSYASRWILQGIHRDCNPLWMEYYFPAHYQEKIFRALQKYDRYAEGEEIGSIKYYEMIAQISYDLGLSEEDVDKTLRTALAQKKGKLNIEDFVALEYACTDTLPEEMAIDEELVFKSVFQKDLRNTIEEVVGCLTEKEKMVVQLRNGIGCTNPMTLEWIGSRMNVTRERVRQIEVKSMRKLRKSSRKKSLDDYLLI